MAPVALPALPDLRDPAPPVAGTAERAAVAARVHQLVRRRRALRVAGALVVVLGLSVGVVAITAGGDNSPSARQVAPAVSPAGTVAITGHVSGIPGGATLTVQLSGEGGTFPAIADADGKFVLHVPTGTYTGTWTWESADHTASSAGRLDNIDVTADQDVDFSVTGR
jgi:hypothetical protein